MLEACSGGVESENAEVVTVVETVTDTPGPDSEPEQPADEEQLDVSSRSSVPAFHSVDAQQYRQGASYYFASENGQVECQMNMSDQSDPFGDFAGGCVSGDPTTSEDGPNVVWGLNPSRENGSPVHMEESPAAPGFFAEGNPPVEAGGVIDLYGMTCFSPAENGLGCMDYRSGEGFQIIGDEVEYFERSDHPEIFADGQGHTQVIGNSLRLSFDNGGVVTCKAQAESGPVSELTCGDATPELNFPDMEGSTIQSNAVFVDFSGGAPVITGHNSSNMGRGIPQTVDQGSYRFRDLTLVHDGERATFTTSDGDSFWVGVDGFGTD